MAVLPWGSYSDASASEHERKPALGLSWFTNTSEEPSRAAFKDLRKLKTRRGSADTGNPRTRSRATTASSQTSPQGQSPSAERPGAHFRAASPSLSIVSIADSPESASKSFFSRASPLKRQSSKMSLTSDFGSMSGAFSPSRLTSSRLGFRRKDSLPSSPQNEKITPTISMPFDFQHVIHTEQTQFPALNRIDESDLASQFQAMQTAQQSGPGLKGISATQLVVADRAQGHAISPTATSSAPDKTTELPATPPAPVPPPKNSPSSLQLSPVEVRMSRSLENFSRPTGRSPVTPTLGDAFTAPRQLQPSAPIAEAQTDLVAVSNNYPIKPLPQLPFMVHAVSTQDDTARNLIAAPLPPPPARTSSQAARRSHHKRQSSSKGALRHMSTFPSPRNQNPSVDLSLRGIQEEPEALPRHRSDNALCRQIAQNSSEALSVSRDSTASQMQDWDYVIDDAWNQYEPTAGSLDGGDAESATQLEGSMIVVEQPSADGESQPSTPVMTMATCRDSGRGRKSPSNIVQSPEPRRDGLELAGLGIDATQLSTDDTESRPSTRGIDEAGQAPRTSFPALSKSSSQDSIIFSIASSIMGTQRSSNSSVYPHDYVHFTKNNSSSSALSCSSSAQGGSDGPKTARPESTCIPASLLKGFINTQTGSHTHLAQNAELGSDDGSAELDDVAPLPIPGPSQRATSASRIPVPQRSSSMHANSVRRLSNASASHPRSRRGSYSLFPQGTPSGSHLSVAPSAIPTPHTGT